MSDTLVLKVNPENPEKSILQKAADIIKQKGIVAFPTETVYGLGASALDESAVEKIYQAKNRPPIKALICHLSEIGDADKIAYMTHDAEKLLKAFSPGPLTVVLKKKSVVPTIVSAGMDTVALRVPDNETARRFISLCGVPIAAPSANISGHKSPKNASDVLSQLDGRIDAVIDGGQTSIGTESTIVSLVDETPTILRIGAISPCDVAFVLGVDENSLFTDNNKKKTSVVGLCGRSGSGKTTAVNYLKSHGFFCIDADEIARNVTSYGSECLEKLCDAFGNDILLHDGNLDRRMLASRAFSSAEGTELLNKITHFYILRKIREEIEIGKGLHKRHIILDAPLLYESGLDAECDFTIAIMCDDETCLKRIMERDGIDRFAAESRMSRQKSREYLESKCDFVISNNGSDAELFTSLKECFHG